MIAKTNIQFGITTVAQAGEEVGKETLTQRLMDTGLWPTGAQAEEVFDDLVRRGVLVDAAQALREAEEQEAEEAAEAEARESGLTEAEEAALAQQAAPVAETAPKPKPKGAK